LPFDATGERTLWAFDCIIDLLLQWPNSIVAGNMNSMSAAHIGSMVEMLKGSASDWRLRGHPVAEPDAEMHFWVPFNRPTFFPAFFDHTVN